MKSLYLLILLSLPFLLGSCVKKEEVDWIAASRLSSCLGMMSGQEYIFNDRGTFEQFTTTDASYELCIGNHPEQIDFSTQTLLGYRINYDHFKREVYDLPNQRVIQIVFRVNNDDDNCFFCGSGSHNVWTKVPKVPENYTIDFLVKKVKEL